jgi:hypothetical protein
MPLLETVYQMERMNKVSLMPFFYSTSNTTLVAAPSTTTTSIAIQSDSHFIARYATITAYTGAANAQVVAATTPPLLIQFLDTAAGRTLFDNPQPIGNVMGGLAAANAFGSLPFIFPEPWLIRAAGSVQVSLTNLGATVFTRVDISLPGIKVFSLVGSGLPNL